jgi:hypothetical protein
MRKLGLNRDLLTVIAFVVLYLVINRWVLSRSGVST